MTVDGNTVKGELYYQVFRRVFPYYLSIGMTYEQFWEMDSSLVRAYRKAEKLRRDTANFNLWLQGRYIFDALCCASPLFRSLSKPGTTAHPYLEKPYEFEKPVQDENERNKQRGLNAMKGIAARFNKSRREREAKKKAAESKAGTNTEQPVQPVGSEHKDGNNPDPDPANLG